MADAALETPALDRASHLREDREGFARLHALLQETNTNNPEFARLHRRLTEVLRNILHRLDEEFPGQVDRVVASDDWARYGFDLRNMPFEEVAVLIVFDLSERPFELYQEVARRVFVELGDRDVFVQFGLATAAEWKSWVEVARHRGMLDALGIPLAVRM